MLYLDIDDTLLGYPNGRDGDPVPADGAAEFVAWAFERFEVRWLTRWCRDGSMNGELLGSFCKMLEMDRSTVEMIRGLDWTCSETKLDGVAWLDHLVLGRPFLWIEDEYGLGPSEREFLRARGFAQAWLHCNVTEDSGSLRRLHERLRELGW